MSSPGLAAERTASAANRQDDPLERWVALLIDFALTLHEAEQGADAKEDKARSAQVLEATLKVTESLMGASDSLTTYRTIEACDLWEDVRDDRESTADPFGCDLRRPESPSRQDDPTPAMPRRQSSSEGGIEFEGKWVRERPPPPPKTGHLVSLVAVHHDGAADLRRFALVTSGAFQALATPAGHHLLEYNGFEIISSSGIWAGTPLVERRTAEVADVDAHLSCSTMPPVRHTDTTGADLDEVSTLGSSSLGVSVTDGVPGCFLVAPDGRKPSAIHFDGSTLLRPQGLCPTQAYETCTMPAYGDLRDAWQLTFSALWPLCEQGKVPAGTQNVCLQLLSGAAPWRDDPND